MNRVFIDVNIPMYAAGTPHPLREPSQRVIMAIAIGRLDAVTDAEVLQEILYRYLHIGERENLLTESLPGLFRSFRSPYSALGCPSGVPH